MARNKRPRAQSHPPMIQAPAARTGSKESRPRSKFSRDKIRGQVRLVDVFCYHCGERFDERRAKNSHYGRWCKGCQEGYLSRLKVDTAKTVLDRYEIINQYGVEEKADACCAGRWRSQLATERTGSGLR